MTPQQALHRLIEHHNLGPEEMRHLMRSIMTGEVSLPLVAALLTALRTKRESVDEIVAAAQVMREFLVPVPPEDIAHLVDLAGTGGDGARTFNISTAACFVAAAAGAKVAKHGSRGVSSVSGSADIMEALGVQLVAEPALIAQSIRDVGIGFMLAAHHHPAMKRVAPVRKEMGVRSIFNILGPLSNPAGATNQLMGVFQPDLVKLLVKAFAQLGSSHVMVVHGDDGLDEISISGPTLVGELRRGRIRMYRIHPEQFGFKRGSAKHLEVETVEESVARVREVLDNRPGPARDIVALNAGAAIYCAGVADSMAEGVKLAEAALANGSAHERLETMAAYARRQPPQ